MKFAKALQLAVLVATAVAAKGYDSFPAVANKSGSLRAFNQVTRSVPPGPRCEKICCDDSTEQTCRDEVTFDALSCALIADGGCPCPEGQERCNADLENGWPGFCDTLCCDETEETCRDEVTFDAVSCAPIAEGGCPCPEGQERCNADPANNDLGFCTSGACCDFDTEDTCFDDESDTPWEPVSCAAIADGGCPCPQGQERCNADLENGWTGFCDTLCCDDSTEETCLDEVTFDPVSCAAIADGGCPCPEGQERCGADLENGWLGFCTAVCCDDSTEETCRDDDTFEAVSCAAIADGGCPCPEGQERCNADPANDFLGFCASVCCDDSTEETCYDDMWSPVSCAVKADSGCPCPEGEERCDEPVYLSEPGGASGNDADNFYMSELVEALGTSEEITKFNNLKMNHQKLLSLDEEASMNSKRALEQKMLVLVGTIERRAGLPSTPRSNAHKNFATVFVESMGTAKEVAYFRHLKLEQQKLSSAVGGSHMKSAQLTLGQKELVLVRTIKLRVRLQEDNPFANKEKISII